MDIQNSLNKLEHYISSENFRGYDPYDTLNSFIPFKIFGNWLPILATQVQKRNPINIRPLLGIKKEYNPKAVGLLLQAYSLLYKKTKNIKYIEKAKQLYDWLINNYSKGYSGICWGYNFPWSSSEKYMEKNIPSSVVTGFALRGIHEYYKISGDESVREIVFNSSNFVKNNLKWTNTDTGICISYTPLIRDICYNASLLGAEILALNYKLNNDNDSRKSAISAVNFVLERQKPNGVWAYSTDKESQKDRMQIDFHQGYILECVHNIMQLTDTKNQDWDNAIERGLSYYHKFQFFENGTSLWRVPKRYPIEIHNQTQGIITFSRLTKYYPEGTHFANKIAKWTINNMQDNRGYFYYQKRKYYTIKIPYMRWSQSWMFLALVNLIRSNK